MPDMAVSLPVQAARDKPKLLDQVRDVIRRKHFSIRTEQAYVDWIRRFICTLSLGGSAPAVEELLLDQDANHNARQDRLAKC